MLFYLLLFSLITAGISKIIRDIFNDTVDKNQDYFDDLDSEI